MLLNMCIIITRLLFFTTKCLFRLSVSCSDGFTNVLDKFAFLHQEQSGNFLEEVSEVTSSHVRLFERSFSTNGVLIKAGFPVKVHCNVLIYQAKQKRLTLHVHLIPRDPARQQVSTVVTIITKYCVTLGALS